MTTVCACEKTVVIVKQPGHLTSMKNDRGAGTRFYTKLIFHTLKLDINVVDAYLELVLASFSGWGWVEKVDCENLFIQ
jgi:hypothetical protein